MGACILTANVEVTANFRAAVAEPPPHHHYLCFRASVTLGPFPVWTPLAVQRPLTTKKKGIKEKKSGRRRKAKFEKVKRVITFHKSSEFLEGEEVALNVC